MCKIIAIIVAIIKVKAFSHSEPQSAGQSLIHRGKIIGFISIHNSYQSSGKDVPLQTLSGKVCPFKLACNLIQLECLLPFLNCSTSAICLADNGLLSVYAAAASALMHPLKSLLAVPACHSFHPICGTSLALTTDNPEIWCFKVTHIVRMMLF
jgi:hypothetical protein